MIAFDPGVLVVLLGAELLYVRAIRILRRRGWDVPVGQQVLWHLGIALQAIALLGPLDVLAQKLMIGHMAQHVLIADIAAPLLLAGLRTPVLVFFPPRSVLVFLAHRRLLRKAFRRARHPLFSIPFFIVILYGWHLRITFVGALENPPVHALQHFCFIFASALVWWPVVDPQQRPLRGELWKVGQIVGMRLPAMLLGMAFIVMRAPAYHSFYGDKAHDYGLSPLTDQQVAGGLMFGVDILIIFFALGYFFFKAAADADRDAEREALAASERAAALS